MRDVQVRPNEQITPLLSVSTGGPHMLASMLYTNESERAKELV